jgi:hypothetical protein
VNRTLRRRHFRLVGILAVLAPGLVAAALTTRGGNPDAAALPAALQAPLPELGSQLEWSIPEVVGVLGDGQVVVEPAAQLVFADMLLLCEEGPAAGAEPGGRLHLLGGAAPGRRTGYRLPPACQGGRLVLVAAADDREIARAKVGEAAP